MSQKTATGQPVPQLINTRRAAEILGRSPATARRWRYEGIGPKWIVLIRVHSHFEISRVVVGRALGGEQARDAHHL